MKTLDTKRIATVGLLVILSLIVIFHVLVLVGVIPFDIVWGGRLKTTSDMVKFESVSILLNLIMILVVAVYAGLIKLNLSQVILKGTLWFMVGMFLLNTLGNAVSHNEMEKLIFTPLTLLLAIFSLRLALSKDQKPVFNS